ncbi:ATP-binding protein, partial [Listeria monocytogenes]|nr:ATP-binding protein [Listeria monocytogenes]
NWWENKELKKTQQKCDDAHDMKNIRLLKEMNNTCFERGQDTNLLPAIRASYLYSSATCLLDIIEFNFNELKEADGLEELYERCLYLMRTARDLCQKAYADLSDDDNISSKSYLNGLFYPLHVNYANMLSQTGRYVKSISTLQSILESNYPMAVGNLALNIINYSYFDRSHQK